LGLRFGDGRLGAGGMVVLVCPAFSRWVLRSGLIRRVVGAQAMAGGPFAGPNTLCHKAVQASAPVSGLAFSGHRFSGFYAALLFVM
jgi:hypothetical protein